ncbi:hypothetical protein ARMSODRAFT_952487 [Armillaria solidipes]|uniref:DUF4238 domain-containing protein n=1 Tax=Armillaria solidipes TaxID=1076256 RepID=A0A2H3BR94_9AGAR|nr:hypothetical protein ARMSODRAFT_952487 [Armillaria solidipes]
MPRRRRAKSAIASAVTPSPAQRDQFHHSIPRFILRRFQTGPRKSKAERRKEYIQTHVDPDHVFYYDLVSGSLDVRSIGTIYGLKNLYRDASNPSNVNELEEKLSVLERDAAVIIEGLHSSLASGKAILKRHDLERLRKFLFIMHYRNCGRSYFNPDHPAGGRQARPWLERYKAKHQCQTHTDVWLHVLRYYLDTPHSQILDVAEAEYRQHGWWKIHNPAATHIDPNFEQYQTIAYHIQAERYSFCIWEANAASEFILTSQGFGLWEGRSGTGDYIHRMFVVSPRIAIVLRANSSPHEGPLPVNSTLLKIRQEERTVKLVNGESSFIFPEGTDPVSVNWNLFRSPDDLFTFSITRLSLSETDAFNAVLLDNVRYDGAITFLGKERMLRTVRTYDHDPVNKHDRQKFTSLMRQLSVTPTAIALATSSYDPVDAKLYAALMGILCNETPFISRYNRALSVFQLLKDPSKRKSCPFVLEHISNFHAALQGCQAKFGRAIHSPGDVRSVTLEPSLSEDISSQVFEALERFVSEKFDVRLTYDTSDILGQVGKDVMLVAFLGWVIDEAFHVLDHMPATMKRVVRYSFVF